MQEMVQAMRFVDSYALGEDTNAVPSQDFTLAFWARTQAWNESATDLSGPDYMTLLSYATHEDTGEAFAYLLELNITTASACADKRE